MLHKKNKARGRQRERGGKRERERERERGGGRERERERKREREIEREGGYDCVFVCVTVCHRLPLKFYYISSFPFCYLFLSPDHCIFFCLEFHQLPD